MDFETFIDTAWTDHASDAAAVARRLDDGIALVADEAQLNRLMHLGQHVYGEHLGEWRNGMGFLDRLAALPAFGVDGASGQAQRRAIAALRLAEGTDAGMGHLPVSDRVRVGAMAAGNLEPWYQVCTKIVVPPVRLWFKFRVEWSERIPKQGPAIIACNHLSYLDPFSNGCAVIDAGRRPRFLAKQELFDVFLVGSALKGATTGYM